ncbi:MAG: hypothetical protein HY301_06600 [Verrucomicrobia bacterium]|nr:hypothetical protein [Verrucomicrobiota bacterium]
MASNPTPDDPQDLLAQAEDGADGLDTYEVAIGVKQNTAAAIRAAITAYRGADTTQGTKKQAKADTEEAVQIADSNAKAWLGTARLVLVKRLGAKWSPAWEPTGFPDQSTAVPNKQEKRMNLCASLKNYFTANPTFEMPDPDWDVTAVRAGAHFTAISDGRDAREEAKTQFTTAQQALATAFRNLFNRVSGLTEEVGRLLGPDDPRWHALGLSMPSDPDTPEPVESFTLSPGTPGMVLASVDRARRATRYRPFIQVVTVDANFRPLPAVHDREVTFKNLPSGKTLRVKFVAANDAGEAPESPVQEIVVP